MYLLTYVYECFIGKEFSYNENGKFQYILRTLIRKKMTIREKWLSQLEVFNNIVVLPIARERENPLLDNIKSHEIDNC